MTPKVIHLRGDDAKPYQLGTFVQSFGTVIEEDCDCFVDGRILFKFRKNAIPLSERQMALDNFLSHAKKKNDNRGVAAGLLDNNKAKRLDGKMNRGNLCTSGIMGFYDKPPPHEKSKLREQFGKVPYSVCRQTAFNKNNSKLFREGLSFFQRIDKLYKQLAPIEYSLQEAFIQRIPQDVRIWDTTFTTITCNYNWQTACHTDRGDFQEGLGNLTVVGDNQYMGGHIGFPEWDIGVDVRSGDVIIMDVHRPHCNTPIQGLGTRLSFVCYARERMQHCSEPYEDVYVSTF